MSTVKILSRWSAPGGSTEAFINLVNAFNRRGISAKFFGPHEYHLSRCPGGLISNDLQLWWDQNKQKWKQFKVTFDDIVIIHFFDPTPFLYAIKAAKQLILSCHEHEIFPIQNINYKIFDKIHYVSDHQRRWHAVNHPYFIIPNIIDPRLHYEPKNTTKKIGGVIGSIDRNKRTHLAIINALNDHCDVVLVYGAITDQEYWDRRVKPLINQYPDKVKYMGYEENKQKIYNSVTDVYHCSLRETWGYIKAECTITHTNFHTSTCDLLEYNQQVLSEKEIVDLWKKELKL